jgi:hypothetical protein
MDTDLAAGSNRYLASAWLTRISIRPKAYIAAFASAIMSSGFVTSP